MSDALEEAAAAALAGELILIPTDTVYGIGTRPDDPAATARLFEAKGRPQELELPVLLPTLAAARDVADVDGLAERLALEFWPGPLTLVLRRSAASAGWDLGGDPATIGVRIPRYPLAVALLSITGPLAVTSANRSGHPTPSTCEELEAIFGRAVSLYLCEEGPLGSRPSTVLDLAHDEPRLLRVGPIGEEALRASF